MERRRENMTVGELIKELSKLDKRYKVVLYTEGREDERTETEDFEVKVISNVVSLEGKD